MSEVNDNALTLEEQTCLEKFQNNQCFYIDEICDGISIDELKCKTIVDSLVDKDFLRYENGGSRLRVCVISTPEE